MDPSSLFGWYFRLELLKIKIIDRTVFVKHNTKGIYGIYISIQTFLAILWWKIGKSIPNRLTASENCKGKK